MFNGNHRTVEGEPDTVDTGVPFSPSDEFIREFMEGLGVLPEEERPITLLCRDSKILSKVIASRLNKVLPKVLTSN